MSCKNTWLLWSMVVFGFYGIHKLGIHKLQLKVGIRKWISICGCCWILWIIHICLTVRFSLNWYARRCAIDVWPRCIFVICPQSVAFQHDCRSNAVIVWDYVLRMLTFVGLDPSLWFCQEHWGLRGSLLLFSSLNLRARYFLLFLEASYSFRIASSAAARGSHCFRVQSL